MIRNARLLKKKETFPTETLADTPTLYAPKKVGNRVWKNGQQAVQRAPKNFERVSTKGQKAGKRVSRRSKGFQKQGQIDMVSRWLQKGQLSIPHPTPSPVIQKRLSKGAQTSVNRVSKGGAKGKGGVKIKSNRC